jgi:hypothetical protein
MVQFLERTAPEFNVAKQLRINAEDGCFLKYCEVPFDACLPHRIALMPAVRRLGTHLAFALAKVASPSTGPAFPLTARNGKR